MFTICNITKSEFLSLIQDPVLHFSADLKIMYHNTAAECFIERKRESILVKDADFLIAIKNFILSNQPTSYRLHSNDQNKANDLSAIWHFFKVEGEGAGTYIAIASYPTLKNQLGGLSRQDKYIFDMVEKVTGQKMDGSVSALDYAENMRSFLESVIAAIPGNIYWMNDKSIFLGCNNDVVRSLGLKSTKDIIGISYEDFHKLAQWNAYGQTERFLHDDQEVIRTKKPKRDIEEPPIPGPDGQMVYYLTTRVPLFDKSNNVVGVVGTSVNITQQKKAEFALEKAKQEAEAANQAKSEFLAMMTHELRTPLNVILGMTQIMQTEACTEAQRQDYLNTIFTSGKTLLDLINDILDFSKAQAGKLQIREEVFELEPLLHQLQKEFGVKGLDNHVEYVVKRGKDLPRYLLADGQRIRQIIYNLSDNALKFTNKGSVLLAIECFQVGDPSKVGLCFEIQDTGIGIPKEKLNTVFEEFTQVSTKKHDEYSRRYGGVGLGLAIVRQLIELMHAKISIVSELGVGTTVSCKFEVKLPSKEQLRELETELTMQPEDVVRQLKPSKILLVEDNLLNQKAVIHLLERFHCTVDIANDGSQALAKMQKAYDLVFMDMSLPDMSGIEVTKTFRQQEKIGRHQRIIALTANVHADDQQACIEAGMDGFLTKPIMLDELRNMLIRYIGLQ